MLIVESTRLDAFFNLALEDYLLDTVEQRGRILYLYRNRAAVVMGKNQNPWRECDVPRIEADGVDLARRVSGGGTVYHDEGNLNFSIMLPRIEYDLPMQFASILSALAAVGVQAVRSGASSLVVDGRKISGNAFCLRRNTALHHGTLLVHADLERLHRYLKPAVDGIETKAIASVPAKVVNLCDVHGDLTIEALSEALVAEFTELYGEEERITEDQVDRAALEPYETKMRTWEWTFGHTPRFEVVSPGGERIAVEDGMIVGTGRRFAP